MAAKSVVVGTPPITPARVRSDSDQAYQGSSTGEWEVGERLEVGPLRSLSWSARDKYLVISAKNTSNQRAVVAVVRVSDGKVEYYIPKKSGL